MKARMIPVSLCVLVALTSCSSSAESDSATAKTTSPHEGPGQHDPPISEKEPGGPSVAVDSEQVFPSGLAKAELVIILKQVPVPAEQERGTVVLFHPTFEAVTVRWKGPRPRRGTLRVCAVDGFAARSARGCTDIEAGESSATLTLPGDQHVGIELTGTWDHTVTVSEIDIEYRNVDYFLATTFPAH